jgi:hypothetical protein
MQPTPAHNQITHSEPTPSEDLRTADTSVEGEVKEAWTELTAADDVIDPFDTSAFDDPLALDAEYVLKCMNERPSRSDPNTSLLVHSSFDCVLCAASASSPQTSGLKNKRSNIPPPGQRTAQRLKVSTTHCYGSLSSFQETDTEDRNDREDREDTEGQ